MTCRRLMMCSACCVAFFACSEKAKQAKVGDESKAPSPAEVAAPPAGLDAALWRDIARFPPTTVSISGFPDTSDVGFITDWLRTLEVPGWPACVRQQVDRVSRYYMVQVKRPDGSIRDTSTLVFYGSFDEDELNACAREAAAALGVEVSSEAGLTVFGDDAMFVRWGRLGDEAVAVADDDARVVDDFFSDTATLAPSAPVVDLLAGAELEGNVWSVGENDYALALLGTASRGYDLSLRLTGMASPGSEFEADGRARLHFDSPALAAQAEGGLGSYVDGITGAAKGVLEEVLEVTVTDEQLVLELSADHDHLNVLLGALADAAQAYSSGR